LKTAVLQAQAPGLNYPLPLRGEAGAGLHLKAYVLNIPGKLKPRWGSLVFTQRSRHGDMFREKNSLVPRSIYYLIGRISPSVFVKLSFQTQYLQLTKPTQQN
jgi:hypothetical protein